MSRRSALRWALMLALVLSLTACTDTTLLPNASASWDAASWDESTWR